MNTNMSMNRILGLVALALGGALLIVAYNSSNAPIDQLSTTLTGRYSNETMLFFGIGIAAAVGGGLLAVFGGRK